MNYFNSRRIIALGASVLLAGGLAATTTLPAAADTRCTGVSIRGDVNGDNRAELAVTEIGRGHPSGGVHLFYGTNGGVVADATGTARDDQFIDQATPLVPGTNEPGDEFGAATAWGDFDSDGCADLAVGAPGENGGDGAITILYGSQQGLAATSAQALSFPALFGGPGDQAEYFGSALVVGDFNHDGVEDLAVGAPDLTVGAKGLAGGVAVIFGAEEAGLNGDTPSDLLTRSTTGVPGNPASGERFGATLAAGDFDRDGIEQLAIVSPSSFVADRLGSVQVVERGAGGYGGPQPAAIGQQAMLEPGQSKPEDDFGVSAAAGDFDNDGFVDLAVGAPGRGCLECDEEYGFGEVGMIFGSEQGLTTDGQRLWSQDSSGIPGRAEIGDGFGASLVAAELDGTAGSELGIGAPEDTTYSGSVHVLRGGEDGPTGVGGWTFTQATPGIGGVSGPYGFGGSLAAAYVQGGGYANLIIAADGQDIGGVRGTGLVNQLASSLTGPKAQGSRTVHLDTAGVKGKPAKYAQFGYKVR